MILSFLESKILLWKVNFHIYFPQWQVMSKVSVEPCSREYRTFPEPLSSAQVVRSLKGRRVQEQKDSVLIGVTWTS